MSTAPSLPAHGAALIHASTVAADGRAALILGPSGSGKSALALQLMAAGATLVSDDQTLLSRRGDLLWAEPPPPLAGRIEARGVGLLAAPHLAGARVVLAVDLTHPETARLPPVRTAEHFGVTIPCLHRVDSAHFPAAILLCLRGGRIA